MKIRNTTKGDLGIAEGYVVPAMGEIDVPEDVLASVSRSEVVRAWYAEGMIVGEDAPKKPGRPRKDDTTPEPEPTEGEGD